MKLLRHGDEYLFLEVEGLSCSINLKKDVFDIEVMCEGECFIDIALSINSLREIIDLYEEYKRK